MPSPTGSRIPITCIESGTHLLQRINVVPPMTAEEEEELCQRHDDARFSMLEALLSVPQGRRLFFGPFTGLLAGEVMETNLVDSSHWNIRSGRLPESRREEMRLLLKGMDRVYQVREQVRKLHLSWVRVENIGRMVFAPLEVCREMVRRRKELLDSVHLDWRAVQELAVDRLSPPLPTDGRSLDAWTVYPELASIRMELDLLEVSTGMDIHRFVVAAGKWSDAREKHGDIIERFVESNLRLVISRVRGYYTGNAMDEMDLVQEGCHGLIQAVSRFDHTRGFRFSTYAVWWIKQSILRAITRHSRLVRVPASILAENSRIRESVDTLTAESGRLPTSDELAEHLEMSIDEVESILSATEPFLSLDHTTGEQDSTIADFLAGTLENPEGETLRRERREMIREALGILTDREKTIITLRFGLLEGNPSSLAEVGDIYGISRERVRQLESRAMEKLRSYCLQRGATPESGE